MSIAIAKLNNDKLNVAKTSKNIGALYEEQKDLVTAMQYYAIAYNYAQQLQNKSLIADCLNNMGVVYEQEYKYKKAVVAYNRALIIYKSQGDEQRIAMTLNNLAIVYKYLMNYRQSIKYYEASLVLSKKLGDQFMIAANQNNLGNVYAMQGNFSKSLEMCLMSNTNAKAINAQDVIIESNDGIATAYEKLNQFQKAIQYRKYYELEKEIFLNKERTALLAEMRVKYETQKKIDEIKILKKETKIKNMEIEKQKNIIQKRNYFLLAFFLLLMLFFVIAYFWKSRQNLRDQLLQEKIIRETEENERIRIAKDIHDDLGSGLTKINFLSEIILQKTSHLPAVKNSGEAVKETAIKMIDNMRDLIWALNPENTTLGNLIARIREYTSDYFEDFPIELQFDFPNFLPQTPITKESHRELFMVVKEVLNNITKHAMATKVFFKIELTTNYLNVTIHDNGIGIPKNKIFNKNSGNGFKNMESRIINIGGQFKIASENGEGTTVELCISKLKIFKS